MLYHPLTGPLPPPLVLALCLPNLRPSQAFLFLPLKFHLERNPGRGPHPDLHLDPALKWSPGQVAGASGRLRTSLKTYCCSRERNDRGKHRGRGPREGPSERKHGHQTLHSKEPRHRGNGLEVAHLVLLPSWPQQGLWPGCTQHGSCPVYGPPFFPFQNMGMGWEPEAVVLSFLLTHHGFC